MRVITGSARGTRLQTLTGESVRPTPERVKEALFSAIQFDIEGRTVLDLFAGSGQLGIEALSRGAGRAVFVDESPESIRIIRENLQRTGLAAKAVVTAGAYDAFLRHTGEQFDIAFLDPPYGAGLLPDALARTAAVMRPHGILIAERPVQLSLPRDIAGFSSYRTYRYGKVAIEIFRRGDVDW